MPKTNRKRERERERQKERERERGIKKAGERNNRRFYASFRFYYFIRLAPMITTSTFYFISMYLGSTCYLLFTMFYDKLVFIIENIADIGY